MAVSDNLVRLCGQRALRIRFRFTFLEMIS
jgi:hypothetical protein